MINLFAQNEKRKYKPKVTEQTIQQAQRVIEGDLPQDYVSLQIPRQLDLTILIGQAVADIMVSMGD